MKKIVALGIMAGVLAPLAASAVTITANAVMTGNFAVMGSISKGSGSFVIDHPLDPKNKLLYHSFVESPDVKNLYDGVATLDERGEATIRLPDYFEALNKDFRYSFTALDQPMPGLYIKEKINGNRFMIGGGEPGGEISWQVTGVRHDPYIRANPVVPEVEKGPGQLVGKGEYLFPENSSRFETLVAFMRSFVLGL